MHTFWLVLTYDLLEDRRIDDVIIKTFFNSLLYKTNRFQVAVRLFSNRSQMTSKCGKNKQVAHKAQPSVSLMFLPHFWRPLWSITEQTCVTSVTHSAWNLFVKHNRGKITIIKKHDENHTSLFGSKGGPSLCRQAWATFITCSNFRGCSSIFAAKNKQQGAKAYNKTWQLFQKQYLQRKGKGKVFLVMLQLTSFLQAVVWNVNLSMGMSKLVGN